MFLPNLLLAKDQKGFALAHQLLLDLFIFLEPYLKKGELAESMRTLYKGTLRVLLVLLHDFPEFLCEYHSSFVSVIPVNCVQLRNIFLSAFPRNMTLHDPFSVGLKIDLLPEIQVPPRILSPLGALGGIRADVDLYLKQRGPPSFLNDLLPKLLNRSGEVHPGIANSLVVYLGMQASMQQRNQQPLMHTPEMDILMALMKFDDKNRYLVLNAIANQLRYPNTHSHFFSCVLLFMFGESKSDAIKEQITRVLLERLIVHRPHPWSLLITFIELIKNPRYAFWTHSFTRCAAEIERVFESVSRSCMSNAEGAGGQQPGGQIGAGAGNA
jgi:CCR4-NOT transcription complex subunit 1